MSKWENWSLEKTVKQVFGSKQGEELIDFLMDAFVHRRSFIEGKPDTSAFNEGEKNIVLMLKQLYEKGAD